MKNTFNVVRPDDEPTSETKYIRYKYSEGLFDWFYSKVRMYGYNEFQWRKLDIDFDRTRVDHSNNGCRIWGTDGTYIKLYEVILLMELTNDEWMEIGGGTYGEMTVQDVVKYYYTMVEPTSLKKTDRL